MNDFLEKLAAAIDTALMLIGVLGFFAILVILLGRVL